MKKTVLMVMCAILIATTTVGVLPRRAEAGGVIAFLAAPILLFDPLTALVIVDAFTCKVNVIWGCDKNGDPLPEPLPSITLTAGAGNVELPNPVVIDWDGSARAVSCEASGEWSGSKATTGSEMVINPTTPASLGNHTYTITCKNSEGASASKTVTATVIGPTATLNGPGTVELPNPISLLWSSQNTVSCTASDGWSGNKVTSGNETVVPVTNEASRGSHTYTISCVNASGYAAVASTVVNVIQVPKCSIDADPSAILPPQLSTLSWSCQYANSCSINNGVGSVNKVSGSKKVSPQSTTTYTLTCQGDDGPRSFSDTVNITTDPRLQEVNP